MRPSIGFLWVSRTGCGRCKESFAKVLIVEEFFGDLGRVVSLWRFATEAKEHSPGHNCLALRRDMIQKGSRPRHQRLSCRFPDQQLMKAYPRGRQCPCPWQHLPSREPPLVSPWPLPCVWAAPLLSPLLACWRSLPPFHSRAWHGNCDQAHR